MERACFSHLSYDCDRVLITVGLAPSRLVDALRAVASAGVPTELLSVWSDGAGAYLRFVLGQADQPVLRAALAGSGFTGVRADRVAVLTVHGVGIRIEPAVSALLHAAMQRAGATVLATSVSNRRLAVVCARSLLDRAIDALLATFPCTVSEPVAALDRSA